MCDSGSYFGIVKQHLVTPKEILIKCTIWIIVIYQCQFLNFDKCTMEI